MLLIFPSNFAIGFSVLQAIYRFFFFSCSPLGNQKWATVIRLLFLRSWSKPDISFFLLLSPPSPCCCCVQASFSRRDLPAPRGAVMILVMLRWCEAEFALGEILFAELMNSSSSLRPRVSQRALWPVLSAQLEVHLSEGFSLGDCLLSPQIWSICKALGSHCSLVSQEAHPKALENS